MSENVVESAARASLGLTMAASKTLRLSAKAGTSILVGNVTGGFKIDARAGKAILVGKKSTHKISMR